MKQFKRVFQPANLKEAIEFAAWTLKNEGQTVRPKTWQARPVELGMHEVFDFSFKAPIPHTIEELVDLVKPDLPWADEHFGERVSGEPMNPAPSYVRWPYYKQDEKWRPGGKFSHTYPERMWTPELEGIRYKYGNLGDVVNLLQRDPMTRQAFLPIWFPEDTGATHGERVPCTIGYWFIHRDDHIDLYYPIRSCDYRRHFKNDIYMACRLLMWVLDELRGLDPYWNDVKPGELHMQVWNLHVFEGEERLI
jgi:hypothetical protein